MFDPRNWTTERKARELDWGACAGKSKFKGEICPGIERVWGRCQHQSSRAHTFMHHPRPEPEDGEAPVWKWQLGARWHLDYRLLAFHTSRLQR